MTREILNRAIKNKVIGKIFIFLFSIILIYLLCSIYFINHLFINNKVNGIDLSLRKYN